MHSITMSSNNHIDFRTMPSNVPVLCIPRVYSNIAEHRIRQVFNELNMGVLDHIDVVPKVNKKGEKFNRVYIHFAKWNDSENACITRERLLNGKEIKIMYDDPWFWKVSAYREPIRRHPSSAVSRQQNPRPLPIAPTLPVAPTLHIAPRLSERPKQQPPCYKKAPVKVQNEEPITPCKTEEPLPRMDSGVRPVHSDVIMACDLPDLDYGEIAIPIKKREPRVKKY